MNLSSKKANLESGRDRISSLPDDVLIYILSLLSTRDAFRTSILSSRWENMWALVPYLSFCPFDGKTEGWDETFNLTYMNFIERILLLHSSSIHQFHLKSTPQMDKSRVSAWISTVVQRNIKQITISDYYTEDYCPNLRLPRCLFNCKTLECLKFDHCLELNVPSLIHLPRLKVLHVTLKAPAKDLCENLFCSSPVLEELKIEVHDDSGRSNYIVSSRALKKLSIDINATQLKDVGTVVTIDVPVLEVLEISDDCFVQYSMKNVSSLLKASVSVDVFYHYDKNIGNMHQLSSLYMLLARVSSVQNLFLNYYVIDALGIPIKNKWPVFPNLTHLQLVVVEECFRSDRLSRWPIFPKLRHLQLYVDNDFGSENLSHLLIWAPNLASLVFQKRSSSITDLGEFYPCEQQVELPCLQSCLREVEVRGLKGTESELKLIKYMLESAQLLEKLTVEYCNSEDLSKEGFQTEILAMPKCSKPCQIIFV